MSNVSFGIIRKNTTIHWESENRKKIRRSTPILKNVVFLQPDKTTKKHQLWLTKFLTNVLLAVLVWTSAPSEPSPKVTSTKSTPMNASSVAPAQVLARAKRSLWMNNL